MAKTTQLGHSISRYLSQEKICGDMLMAALYFLTKRKIRFTCQMGSQRYLSHVHLEIFVTGKDLWGHVDGSTLVPDKEKDKVHMPNG